MSYIETLEKAGAEVIAHEYFGSYQGDIWVKVRFNGEVGWVNIGYGSCSGCDSYEATFSYNYEPTDEELAEFGLSYLDGLYSQEEAENIASRNLDWDMDAKGMLDFIKAHRAD